MRTKTKPKNRNLVTVICGLSLMLLTLLILAALLPTGTPVPQPTMPVITHTTSATEETLPPPPANPYGRNDFQYENGYLTCLKGESVLGIDVSSHQGDIDWQQVADAGIEFVMIRAGYRGYETGDLVEDSRAQENYEGAKDAGLQIGAYFFSQATSLEEAAEEAQFFLEIINGWELSMPVVYDWEYIDAGARTGDMDKRTVTDCTLVFCQMLESVGYSPMIYFNRHQAADFLYLEELTDYPFWLALYSDRMTYPYKLSMWQYTEKGKVPGIDGYVDIDLYFPE